jgi:serine/threonine protein kinase
MQTTFNNDSIFSRMRANAPLEWEPGMLLCEKYKVVKYLGEGGFASVWQIRHLDWNMDLAVKRLLKKHLRNTSMIEAFLNECLSWIELGMHPNITACCYVEKIGGAPCVFAQYVDGGTLHDWIRTKKLYQGSRDDVLERIFDIAIQFAYGLNYAHSCGMIHQDVKPSNVLLSQDGIVRVSDFGLVRAKNISGLSKPTSLPEDDQNTIIAQFGGYSRLYCSPEQGGGSEILTRRTDIYSWAVSVLEMFCGKTLWPSGSVVSSLIDQYTNSDRGYLEIPIPEKMLDLLKDCLAVEPDSRPHDFSKIIESLLCIYRDIFSQEYSRPEPGALEMPASVLNNQCLSLLELGEVEPAQEKLQEALSISPNHPEAVFNSGIMSWRRGEISDRDLEKSIERISRIKAIDKSYKNFLFGSIELERGDYSNARDHVSDMNDQARYTSAARLYRNWIADNRKETFSRKIIGHQASLHMFNVVPGGQYVVSLDNMFKLALWQLGNARLIHQFPQIDFGINGMASSSEWVALAGNVPQVKVVTLKDGEDIADFNGHSAEGIRILAASPDSSYLLTGGYDGKAILRKINPGGKGKKHQEVLLAEFEKPVSAAVFSRDSQYLSVADERKNVAVWNLGTGELEGNFKLKSYAVAMVFIDNQRLASGTNAGYVSFNSIPEGKEFAPRLQSQKTIRSLDVYGELMLVAQNNGSSLQLYDMEQHRCLRSVFLDMPTSSAAFACGHLAVWTCGNEINLSSLKFGPKVELLHSIPYLPDDLKNLNRDLSEILDKMGNALKYHQYESAIRLGYEAYKSPLLLPSRFFTHIRKINDNAAKTSVHSIKSAFKKTLKRDSDIHLLKTYNLSGILLGVDSGNVFVVDAFTGESVSLFELSKPVSCAAYSPLSARIFLGGENEIKVLDLHQWEIINKIPARAEKLIVSGDGEFIMAFTGDDTIKVWDKDLSKRTVSFKVREKMSALEFIPDSDTFYYAGEKKNCLLRSSITNKVGYFRTNNDIDPLSMIGARGLFIDSSASFIISTHADKALRVWAPGVEEPKRRIQLESEVITGVIAPDAPIFAAGCSNGDIVFINLKAGKGEHYTFPLGASPVHMAFSQTGLFLYVFDDQSNLHALSVNWRFRHKTDFSYE